MILLLALACAHVPASTAAAAPPATGTPATGTPASTSTETSATTLAAPPVEPWTDPNLGKLLAAAAADGDHAWRRLGTLTDDIGNRFTGTAAFDRAVQWGLDQFAADHIAARKEPVTLPSWSRGDAHLTMLAPRPRDLAVLALGGSVGTPEPVEADVVVVHSFDELGPQVAGRIVLYNVPMGEGVPTVAHYGDAVKYRVAGAAKAAPFGAVATLVRSVTTRSLYTPHTGGSWYEEGGPRIPTAAVTDEDADQIERLIDRGIPVRVKLQLGCAPLPDVPSGQVVAEIRGSTHPEEIVLLGAHLDSWDVGQGAQDDGAGVIELVEAMRLIHELGVPPQRTIRAVLYANEEWGTSGAKAYEAAHGGEVHVVAVESDLGGGAPRGWGFTGTAAQSAWFRGLIAPLGFPVGGEGGGADIAPLGAHGTALVGFLPDDTHYFDIHHTNADTLDKIDPAALRASVGAIAGFAWQAANAPGVPTPVPTPPKKAE